MAITWNVKITTLEGEGNYTISADVTDDITKVIETVNILSCRLDDEKQKQHAWDTLKAMYEKQTVEKATSAKKISSLQVEAVSYLAKAVIKGGVA